MSAWQDEQDRILVDEWEEDTPSLTGGRRAGGPPLAAGDGRGAWRPGDDGPPAVERPDDYERTLLPPGGWMELAGWVRHPDDGRWVRPEALPPEPSS